MSVRIRNNVYKAVRDKLKEGLTDLQYVDLQKGQFRRKPQNYPIPLPACLVEFKQIQWSGTSGGQIGDSTLSIYYYLDLVTDSFDTAEQENETIDILENADIIYEVLQEFSGENFNPLDRTADDIEEYGERYVCLRIDFKTALFHPDPPQKTAYKPKPNIKI